MDATQPTCLLLVDDGLGQHCFRREVEVDGSLREPDFADDVVHPGLLEALARKNLRGNPKDLIPGGRALGRAACVAELHIAKLQTDQ